MQDDFDIFQHYGHYISALEQIIILMLKNYGHLTSVNKTFEYCHAFDYINIF